MNQLGTQTPPGRMNNFGHLTRRSERQEWGRQRLNDNPFATPEGQNEKM
jgi:hypothetical protein